MSGRLTLSELIAANRAKDFIINAKDAEISRLKEQLSHHTRRAIKTNDRHGRNGHNGHNGRKA